SDRIHVYFTVNSSIAGGTMHTKVSPLSTIAFGPGVGTIVMQDGSGLLLNNATSTKQHVTPATGIVVLAANTTTGGNTWHHEVAPVTGLALAVAPGNAGTQNAMTVTGATPNVTLGYYTAQSTGTSVISRPNCPAGITIGLAQPYFLLGTARSNA